MTDNVVRMWKATIAASDVAAWVDTYRTRVLPKMNSIDGFRGAQFLVERDVDPCGVTVLTTFDSMDAVRRFAGEDPARTVLPDFMAAYFPTYDDRASFHDQVLLEPSI